MKLSIEFSEISRYVEKRYNQNLTLRRVDDNTVSVTVKIAVISKSLNLCIEEVTADSVTLRYNAGFGVDSIISLLLSFFATPQTEKVVKKEEGHRIRVELTGLNNSEKALEYLALEDIRVKEDGLSVIAQLK